MDTKTNLNPQGEQMADESMVRTLAAQIEAIWPQEKALLESYGLPREARVLASLNHPNIATIHGVEESDGVHALVLELVEGPTVLRRILDGSVRRRA